MNLQESNPWLMGVSWCPAKIDRFPTQEDHFGMVSGHFHEWINHNDIYIRSNESTMVDLCSSCSCETRFLSIMNHGWKLQFDHHYKSINHSIHNYHNYPFNILIIIMNHYKSRMSRHPGVHRPRHGDGGKLSASVVRFEWWEEDVHLRRTRFGGPRFGKVPEAIREFSLRVGSST